MQEVHDLTNSMSEKLQKQAGDIGEMKGRADMAAEQRQAAP